MRPYHNLENNTLLGKYCRVLLVSRNVQAHSSLQPTLEYNQEQTPLMKEGLL